MLTEWSIERGWRWHISCTAWPLHCL